jgi:chaperonin cofactor prefoldin
MLILGETWQTSRNQSKRRDNVDDRIEELSASVASLTQHPERIQESLGDLDVERQQTNELARSVEQVVEIGLQGGWAGFEDLRTRR